MWYTPQGEKHFDGPFGTLLAVGLTRILYMLKPHLLPHNVPIPFHSGYRAFDHLTREQQVAALFEVGSALLRVQSSPPDIKAYHEAAAATVFWGILLELEHEIREKEVNLRHLVLRVFDEKYNGLDPLVMPDCDDLEDWKILLDDLAAFIIWDDSFENDSINDLSPEKREEFFDKVSIDRDYYIAIPPDPPHLRAREMALELALLCQSVMDKAMSDWNRL